MLLFLCLQLASAPKVLPPSLVSADFAANQLTRIYPYTFGRKPKLRYKCVFLCKFPLYFWRYRMPIYTLQCPLLVAPRSVYLHNNKLTDVGLPDDMFNGSISLEILTMSSNFLRVVPKNMPASLYRLHLKVPHNTLEHLAA